MTDETCNTFCLVDFTHYMLVEGQFTINCYVKIALILWPSQADTIHIIPICLIITILFFFLPILIHTHLAGWKLSRDSLDQAHILSKSDWSSCDTCQPFVSWKTLASSAERKTSDSVTISTIVLMYITNRTGANTEPCGIPFFNWYHDKHSPFTMTLCHTEMSWSIWWWTRQIHKTQGPGGGNHVARCQMPSWSHNKPRPYGRPCPAPLSICPVLSEVAAWWTAL